MKIEVTIDGTIYPATLPYEGADFVRVKVQCPACKAEDPDGISIQGGEQTTGHDTITAKAGHAGCGAAIGEIVVTVDTLFGIEEDRAVLKGRCRVY